MCPDLLKGASLDDLDEQLGQYPDRPRLVGLDDIMQQCSMGVVRDRFLSQREVDSAMFEVKEQGSPGARCSGNRGWGLYKDRGGDFILVGRGRVAWHGLLELLHTAYTEPQALCHCLTMCVQFKGCHTERQGSYPCCKLHVKAICVWRDGAEAEPYRFCMQSSGHLKPMCKFGSGRWICQDCKPSPVHKRARQSGSEDDEDRGGQRTPRSGKVCNMCYLLGCP